MKVVTTSICSTWRRNRVHFRLRHDAAKWFKHIRASGYYKMDFDSYYLCLLVGLAARRKEAVAKGEAADLVEHFPGEYKASGGLLAGLVVCAELDHHGIDVEERKDVQSQLRRLLDPESSSRLSDEGVGEMNSYASGGFEYLCEKLQDPPRDVSAFLPRYMELLTAVRD